jgi:ABC-type sugar transport system permease subunit
MVQKAGKMSRRKMREGLKAYAFMAPALVILILFTITRQFSTTLPDVSVGCGKVDP